MAFKDPYLIEFPKIGDSTMGYLSVAESLQNIPFEIKRIFWTYYTPESIVRGRHAHHETEMILIAVTGRITVITEFPNEKLKTFVLDKPNVGLYLPKYCWHTMQYSHTAVQLVLASTLYSSEDYIRDYEEFKELDF